MNSKVWLTVYAILALLLIGGAGFFAYSSYGKYSEALSGWDSKVGTIERLEKNVPYPSEENVEVLQEEVDEYKQSVDDLLTTLNQFQRELNTSLPNTEFQQLLKKRVAEFRSFAEAGGMQISASDDFQLGFDSYSATLPKPELVPLLDYELEAIDRLLKTLVTKGAVSLETFERDLIPGETGSEREYASDAVHKYPVRLRFTANHGAFQSFINEIANDESFFYIVRVLKVRNQVTQGPVKLNAVDASTDIPSFQNPVTKQAATYEMMLGWGLNVDPPEEVEAKAKAAGFVSTKQDARVLMGQEMLNVFMVVDIVRFPGPDEQVAKEEEESDSKTRRQ